MAREGPHVILIAPAGDGSAHDALSTRECIGQKINQTKGQHGEKVRYIADDVYRDSQEQPSAITSNHDRRDNSAYNWTLFFPLYQRRMRSSRVTLRLHQRDAVCFDTARSVDFVRGHIGEPAVAYRPLVLLAKQKETWR